MATTVASEPAASTANAGNRRVLVPLSLLALYLIWGSIYVAIGFGVRHYPPLLFAAAQYATGVLLYLVLRLRGVPAPTGAQWRRCAGIGVLLLGVGTGLLCVAQQWVASGLAAIEVASVPLFAAVFARMAGRRASRREWLGVALGFAGVIVLNLDAGLRGSPIGIVALLCASAAWALGSVWSQRLAMPAPLMAAAAQMICGSAALAVTGLALGQRWPATTDMTALLALVYAAVAGSIVAYAAYVYLLGNVRPALATSYAYVNPPAAVLLGAWLAGEAVRPGSLIAMAMILLAVWAIASVPRNAAAKDDGSR